MSVRITGAPTTIGSDGSVPLRREIRDLQRNFPDQFNLLILGLRGFMQQDEEALTSYYQIAGIHGMPFKPWDNVQGISDWEFGGYCTHSSVLFVPWHRPYCALFEQALYAVVQGIAKQFPAEIRDKYVAAAQTFRLPYFDWAMMPPAGSSAFPTSLSSSTVSVVDVDGKTKSLANPFYQFSFHPVNPEQGDFDAQVSFLVSRAISNPHAVAFITACRLAKVIN
jgi:tyrosinase